MGYIFNSAQLRAMNNQLSSASNTLSAAVQGTNAAINAVSNSSAIQGQGATTIQNYLAQVHQTCICGPLLEALYALQRGFATYYSQYIAMEPINDAVINTDELETIKGALAGVLSQFELAEKEMYSVMTQVAEVSNQKYDGLGMFIPLKIDSMSKHLSSIADQIGAIEIKGSSDVQSIQDTINSISRLIYQYCTGGFQISNYSKQSLVSSDAYTSLCTSMSVLGAFNDELEKQSDQVNELLVNIEQQWTEREKDAQKWKLGLAVLETVVFVAAVTTTGPVGAAVVCGIAGAFNNAVSETLDQWASGEQAVRGGFDFETITYEGLKGGLQGAAKGYMGATLSHLPSESSFLGKMGKNIIKSFSNEMMDVPFELIDSMHEGNLAEKWDEITSSEYAFELVGKCTVESLLDVTVADWLDGWGDGIRKHAADKAAETGFDIVWKTGSKIVTKKAEDASGAFVEGFFAGGDELELDMGQAVSDGWQDLKDFSSIKRQAFNAFLENASVELYQESSLFDSRIIEAHQEAVNERIQNDPYLQSIDGPHYVQYELTMGGPHVTTPTTSPDMVIVLDHSNPDAQYMREIFRTEGARVEREYTAEDTGRIKSYVKTTNVLVTAIEEKSEQKGIRRPVKCLDSIMLLQK